MENQKNQQLSTVELVNRYCVNRTTDYLFILADKSILHYPLELVGSPKRPLTFSCSFYTSKLVNGIPRGYDIEICQLIVYGDQIGIDIKN
ncbi:hypothetical protein, partial [Nostoc sp. FACHB-133]|uniref:hypothetical protein n=1 Tax=Nostoc sp. FACHB-133 TaxID=2692835 RepID=UPI0016889163